MQNFLSIRAHGWLFCHQTYSKVGFYASHTESFQGVCELEETCSGHLFHSYISRQKESSCLLSEELYPQCPIPVIILLPNTFPACYILGMNKRQVCQQGECRKTSKEVEQHKRDGIVVLLESLTFAQIWNLIQSAE